MTGKRLIIETLRLRIRLPVIGSGVWQILEEHAIQKPAIPMVVVQCSAVAEGQRDGCRSISNGAIEHQVSNHRRAPAWMIHVGVLLCLFARDHRETKRPEAEYRSIG